MAKFATLSCLTFLLVGCSSQSADSGPTVSHGQPAISESGSTERMDALKPAAAQGQESDSVDTTDTSSAPEPMQGTPRFVYDGQEYEFVTGEIGAVMSDPYWCDKYNGGKGKTISWFISFDGRSKTPGQPSPGLSLDYISIDALNWIDLVGFQTRWTSDWNEETNEGYGTITASYDQWISDGHIHIASRNGAEFYVVASGTDEQGKRFAVEGPAVLKGLHVYGSGLDTDETIRARVSDQIEIGNFQSTPFEVKPNNYSSGIAMGSATFSPVVE